MAMLYKKTVNPKRLKRVTVYDKDGCRVYSKTLVDARVIMLGELDGYYGVLIKYTEESSKKPAFLPCYNKWYAEYAFQKIAHPYYDTQVSISNGFYNSVDCWTLSA